MRSTSTMPTPAAIPRRSTISSPSAICARSPTTRSPRSRPGWSRRRPIRKKAASTTCTAAPKAWAPMASRTSAGKSQQGFTYLAVMIVVATLGFGLAAIGEFTSHAQQREKEVELLFVGNEFRQEITAYYEQTPGVVKRYPQKLEDLLQDKRYPMAKRYLRRIYA